MAFWGIFFPINIKFMAVIGVDLGGRRIINKNLERFVNIKANDD